jgi:hypothetical protein
MPAEAGAPASVPVLVKGKPPAYLVTMAIREILEVPDPRLKTVSTPVTEFDEELRTLVADMFETMYDAPGIGLAAIQVGVPKRVLVIDLQPEDPDAEPVRKAAYRSPTSMPMSTARRHAGCAIRTSTVMCTKSSSMG